MLHLYDSVWYFVVYSFFGWCIEVGYAAFVEKRFVNRGFLNGPVCPIYGAGVLLVRLILFPLRDTWITLFVCSVLITSTLEFMMGYLLEKIFKNKWWDYSDMKWNLNGYICLRFSFAWGAACVFAVKLLFPVTDRLLKHIPYTAGVYMEAAALGLMIIDFVITVITVVGLNRQMIRLEALSKAIRMYSDSIGEFVSKNISELKEKSDSIGEFVSKNISELKEKSDSIGEFVSKNISELKEKSDSIGETVSKNISELKKKYDEMAAKNHILRRRLLGAFPTMRSAKYNKHLRVIKQYILNKLKIKK